MTDASGHGTDGTDGSGLGADGSGFDADASGLGTDASGLGTDGSGLGTDGSGLGTDGSGFEADARWAVIIPVKPTVVGKSRLEVAGVDRVALARAIALDTIAAAAACDAVAQVFVVTDDGALVASAYGIPGLRFVPESEGMRADRGVGAGVRAGAGSVRGIDAAVALGAAAAGERMPRAALLGDLPALRPADLAVALSAAASVDRGVVPDAEGTGSTLVTARAGVAWSSAFGLDSFARHLASGCVALRIPDASTLRRDVDTAAQLATAESLGLGPRTGALIGSRVAEHPVGP